MIRFSVTNVKGDNPMWSKLFIIGGDGADTLLKINLESSPVGMEFHNSKKPTLAFHRAYEGPELNSMSLTDGVLQIEFTRPLAAGEWVHLPVEFYYEGEA
jgi:hypothetical protein